jgi:hypothetical protein
MGTGIRVREVWFSAADGTALRLLRQPEKGAELGGSVLQRLEALQPLLTRPARCGRVGTLRLDESDEEFVADRHLLVRPLDVAFGSLAVSSPPSRTYLSSTGPRWSESTLPTMRERTPFPGNPAEARRFPFRLSSMQSMAKEPTARGALY